MGNIITKNIIGKPDAYTKLLISSDYGAGTTFFDRATNKAITNNNVTKSSTQKKFGNTSAYFNGTTAGLILADSDDFYFNVPTTIDTWVYYTAFTRYGDTIYKQYISSISYLNSYDIVVDYCGDGSHYTVRVDYPTYATTGYDAIYGGSTVGDALSLNTWYHIAVIYNAPNVYLYINGILKGTNAGDYSPQNYSDVIYIGYDRYYSSDCLYGYLDEFRISKGIARWTSNFTPPTRRYGHNSV